MTPSWSLDIEAAATTRHDTSNSRPKRQPRGDSYGLLPREADGREHLAAAAPTRHYTFNSRPKRQPRGDSYGLLPRKRTPRGAPRVGHRMMVATRDFTARIDGQTERIVAGVSYISAEHPVVSQYPERFRPSSQRRHIRRDALAPVRPLSEPFSHGA
jgi:hypothetical protein